jgi:hypothetical protein
VDPAAISTQQDAAVFTKKAMEVLHPSGGANPARPKRPPRRASRRRP